MTPRFQQLVILAFSSPAAAAASSDVPLNALDAAATALYLLLLAGEATADQQMMRFQTEKYRRLRAKEPLGAEFGRGFLCSGLWRYSRHPNYFGEFVLWCGQFILCASAFTGNDATGAFVGSGWLCALSPAFVYLLLNYVSGVPLLEKRSDAKWGAEAAYVAYKKETWTFFLLPTRRTAASAAPPSGGEP